VTARLLLLFLLGCDAIGTFDDDSVADDDSAAAGDLGTCPAILRWDAPGDSWTFEFVEGYQLGDNEMAGSSTVSITTLDEGTGSFEIDRLDALYSPAEPTITREVWTTTLGHCDSVGAWIDERHSELSRPGDAGQEVVRTQDVVWTQPQQIAARDVEVGLSWSGTSAGTVDDSIDGIKDIGGDYVYTVTGEEIVSVPAGMFQAFILVATLTDADGMETEARSWSTLGVGLVADEDRELSSASFLPN
jgi:hypothetical protein